MLPRYSKQVNTAAIYWHLDVVVDCFYEKQETMQDITMMLYRENIVNVHTNALSWAGCYKLYVLSVHINDILYIASLLC